MQVIEAFTGAAVSGDPNVFQQAAAAFDEFGGMGGTHGEFRAVTDDFGEAEAGGALLYAGRYCRRHFLAGLA